VLVWPTGSKIIQDYRTYECGNRARPLGWGF
jgi:hypothetical protein